MLSDWPYILSAREVSTLGHSFFIGIMSALGATTIASVLTLLWLQPSFQQRSILKYILFIPLFIPPFLHALTWDNLLIELARVGILDMTDHVASFRSMKGIIMLLSLAYAPLPLLILLNGIRRIPKTLVDSGLLSSTPLVTGIRIMLPQLVPSWLTGFLLTFMFCFTTFDVPEYYGVPVFVTEVFASFSARYETGRALFLSSIPVGITIVVMTLLIKRLIGTRVFFTPSVSPDYTFRIQNRLAESFLWIFYSIVIIFSAGIPLTTFIMQGSVFSPGVRHALFSSREIIFNTFWISAIGGLVTLLVAVLVYGWIYKRLSGRIIVLSLFAIPAITYGIVCIMVLNQPFLSSVYATTGMLVVAYTLRFVPVVCEILYTHATSIHPQIRDAAKLASPVNLSFIKTIWWPINRPALIAGWMVGFWLIVSELPITLLLQPPGFQTVTSRIYIFLHYGSQQFTNALTLSLVSLSLLPVIVVFIALSYEKRNT